MTDDVTIFWDWHYNAPFLYKILIMLSLGPISVISIYIVVQASEKTWRDRQFRLQFENYKISLKKNNTSSTVKITLLM